MLKHSIEISNLSAIVTLRQGLPLKMGAGWIEPILGQLKVLKCTGVLFDLSNVKRVSFSDLGSLIELLSCLQRDRFFSSKSFAIGVCGVEERALKRLKSHGLADVLPLFATKEDALADINFKRVSLRGYKAVVLCGEKFTRAAPLSLENSIPMLDFLGKPILSRSLDHLAQFGIDDFAVCLGHLGDQIPQYFRHFQDHKLNYFKETSGNGFHSRNQENSAANMLIKLRKEHHLFEQDTFVLQGSVLSDFDAEAMMNFHKISGADVTLLGGENKTSSTGLHSGNKGGVGIFSPRIFDGLLDKKACTSFTDVIDALAARGAKIRHFHSENKSFEIVNGQSYFAALSHFLGRTDGVVVPVGCEIEPGVWVAKGSQIGRRVKFSGASFVGEDAHIHSGNVFEGTNVIGEHCEVERNSILRNCVLRPFTKVEKRSFVDQMIAGPNWAINHKFADGRLQTKAPLAGILSVGEKAQNLKTNFQVFGKIA